MQQLADAMVVMEAHSHAAGSQACTQSQQHTTDAQPSTVRRLYAKQMSAAMQRHQQAVRIKVDRSLAASHNAKAEEVLANHVTHA